MDICNMQVPYGGKTKDLYQHIKGMYVHVASRLYNCVKSNVMKSNVMKSNVEE